jgi:transposase
LVSLLHGRYRLSDRETQDFLTAVCGLPIGLGSIPTCCAWVSIALAPVDAAIHAHVQRQGVANIDETSWRVSGQRGWLWTLVTEAASCFRIARSRSCSALLALIGDSFRGIVGSDRLKVYNLLPDDQRQLCWAHLLRNLRALADYQHPDSDWAERMLAQVDALFVAWHAYRIGLFDRAGLQQALIPVRMAMRKLLTQGQAIAWYRIQGLSTELLAHWGALWTFSQVEGVEPTNNGAERALRPAVLWRRVPSGCLFRHPERRWKPVCRADADCHRDLRSTAAQPVCVPCGDTRRRLDRSTGADVGIILLNDIQLWIVERAC